MKRVWMLAAAPALLAVGFIAGLVLQDHAHLWLHGSGPEGANLRCLGRVCVGTPVATALSVSNQPGGLTGISCGERRLELAELIERGCPERTYTAAFSTRLHEIHVEVRDGRVAAIHRYRFIKAPGGAKPPAR